MHHSTNAALARAIAAALPPSRPPSLTIIAPPSATKTNTAPQSQPEICKTNPTPPTRRAKPLNPNQLTAARLLLAGQSVNAVAATLGVDPYTVSRWKKDPRFQTELRRQIYLQANPPPTHTAPQGATARHIFNAMVQNEATRFRG